VSSSSLSLKKEALKMKEQDKTAHAMTSFALFGGLFLGQRPKTSSNVSNPQDYKPYNKK
jgi:hypothetical protein